MHLVDKALRVLGTGELLFKVRQAKAGVDALAEDAAQVLLALHDGHACLCLMRGQRGRHAGRSAADNPFKGPSTSQEPAFSSNTSLGSQPSSRARIATTRLWQKPL